MIAKILPHKFETIEGEHAPTHPEYTVVHDKENNEYFLLKSFKASPERQTNLVAHKLRFKHELDIASLLDHSNIAKPVFHLKNESMDAIAFPYGKGRFLSSLLSKDAPSLAPERALRITVQLLSALEYIHGRGIIHANIHPDACYIDDAKGLQLLDFGMSLTEDEAVRLPDGGIVGTFPYLSPEQMGCTEFKIDTRTDLYCAAIILYRMLAGSFPFPLRTNTVDELQNQAIRIGVLPLHKLPMALNGILLKALKPTPIHRYQTAAGFRHDCLIAAEALESEHQKPLVPGIKDTVLAINRSRLFVARTDELDMLKHGYEQLLQGRPGSFCLYGRSGIGKTEIVREFRRTLPQTDVYFIASKCNSFTPQQPYSILRQIALEYISLVNSGGRTETDSFAAAVENRLSGHAAVICRVVPEMRPYFAEVRTIDAVEPEKEANRTAYALFMLFSTLFIFKPAIMFIDDIQWIDAISLGLLRRLLGDGVRVMFVATLRIAEDVAGFIADEKALRSIGIRHFSLIEPFTSEEIQDFIQSRFGDGAATHGIIDLLSIKTDCSPFALAAALRFLVNKDFLRRNGAEWFFAPDLTALPEKLDPAAIILDFIRRLTPDELNWLQAASLAQGAFQAGLIDSVAGHSTTQSGDITEILQNAEMIVPQLDGGFRFLHDRIQESIRIAIPEEKQYALFEKFGALYEQMAKDDGNYLTLAAESYLKIKEKKPIKTLHACYKAATFAVETAALEVAARYYGATLDLVALCRERDMPAPIDEVKMRIEFGDVLILLGKNEKALEIFQLLLKDALDEKTLLEIKYKIGTIYHNTGDFKKSTAFFTDALKTLNIRCPTFSFVAIFSILMAVIEQTVLSLGLKHIMPKNNTVKNILAVRILNKLSFSLFYQNAILSQCAHLRALNRADCIGDSAEKAEAYTCHIISAFTFFMRKRAFRYFNKAIEIAERINRKDVLALARCFGGTAYYYDAKWKEAEANQEECLTLCKNMGDLWGQVVPLENYIYLCLQKGDFQKCESLINRLTGLDEECNDVRGLATAHSVSNYIRFVKGIDSDADWASLIDERESALFNSPLNQVICDTIISKRLLFQEKIDDAYAISEKILRTIKGNHLYYEYLTEAFSNRGEILIQEYFNRKYKKGYLHRISLSDNALKKQLLAFSCLIANRGVRYPAHRGAAYRCFAWYNAFKKRNRCARYFFEKAIIHHHKLDMRFEEAKSLRDFGFFHDSIHEPGKARDYFSKAYALFAACGAHRYSARLEDITDKKSVECGAPREMAAAAGLLESAGDHIRLDALYDASVSLSHGGAMDELVRRIVISLVEITGAHYGILFLDGDEFHERREFAVDYEERVLPRETVSFSPEIIDLTRMQRRIVISHGPVGDGMESGRNRSILCAPLLRGVKYYGCVYLANTLVTGLFSESAAKAAQIISAQAAFLIENAFLMDEYKRLNARLEQKVEQQTRDIREKNDQLSASHLKLIESERMKELLSGTIVHDLKNHLFAIASNNRALNRYAGANVEMRAILNDNALVCSAAMNLSANILEISKMEEGRLSVRPRRIHFEELAAMGEKYGRNVLFEEKRITFTVTRPKNDFCIEADIYLLERILQNLFANAAQYADEGGAVTLSFDERADESIVTFSTSSPLIPNDIKEIIFEKYFRIDGKSSPFSKGIGLFFCKMGMTAHGGDIRLDIDENGNHFKLGFRRV